MCLHSIQMVNGPSCGGCRPVLTTECMHGCPFRLRNMDCADLQDLIDNPGRAVWPKSIREMAESMLQ